MNHESTKRTLAHLPDRRQHGYRSSRSPGEQVDAIRRALAAHVLAEPNDAVTDIIAWIDRGCLPLSPADAA